MKQISTAVGLWYKMNTQADMAGGPGWWAGDGAQVVTIAQLATMSRGRFQARSHLEHIF